MKIAGTNQDYVCQSHPCSLESFADDLNLAEAALFANACASAGAISSRKQSTISRHSFDGGAAPGERSRERPAQDRLVRDIEALEQLIAALDAALLQRKLSPQEAAQHELARLQRDELRKRLKKTQDAALRAKRYRIRKAFSSGDGLGSAKAARMDDALDGAASSLSLPCPPTSSVSPCSSSSQLPSPIVPQSFRIADVGPLPTTEPSEVRRGAYETKSKRKSVACGKNALGRR